MEIHRLNPTDADQVDRAWTLLELANRTETPELPMGPKHFFTGEFIHPLPHTELRGHLAVDGDETLGYLRLYLPMKSNDHYAEAEITVHPGHRRRGVGTALLEHLLATARAEARTEIVVLARVTWEDGPVRPTAGPEFLEQRGFTAALTEVDRRLEVAALDAETERRLRSEAEAGAGDDYELVQWTGHTPEEYLEPLGRIESMIFDEIPLGDVDLHRREIDVDYIRARDERTETLGATRPCAAAFHKGSGVMAAYTSIHVFADDAQAHQAITIVDPAHRGHRLGLLVKLANLRQLRDRFGHVKEIWAGNADTNAHMVAINERLGFETVDARVSYKLTLERRPPGSDRLIRLPP
ncbi:GNAT family N-acetyltransferase [Glycomyces tenuis]|uniref:GNAT family N-acetyltransferase n=1 Tax=Glycomyces tenuis TaxID=58116 RepID=UPI000413555A|nr:GNAT family N-acetyltransferase [Glycomyces tenuis]